ncbi:copper resistance protein B [Pseudoxanthomonas sacheonensis]|uniref:Copper resistance protein B n=1 Tax=Pseudoxanthomonas sacheonensis TaxID=443615 RepID=A0ABU1RS25_9GAMM|nr:copper resistance protein B [Pseudoxanthomonas sacheonensis]MDR6840695.1 copper resistance protein B [Pseudoxanthomonas sacheonensis]
MKASNRLPKINSLCLVIGLSLGTGQLMAQEMDHSTMQMPASSEQPEPSLPKVEATEEKPATPSASTDPHAGHGGMTTSAPKGEAASAQQVDHAAMGHDMPTSSAPPVPMDHSAMDHGAESPAPTQPRTPIPAVTDADRAAAAPPSGGHPAHDNSIQHHVLLDRLEGWDADPGAGTAWAMQGWLGTDLNRLWLRSEGERVDGRTESADLEVLYGRSVARWWDVVAGIRHDFNPGGSQDFAAIGVMGLAPYMFEVQATGYIGQSGQTAARLEIEYEMLLTNRLILQPMVEVDFYGRNDERRGIGSGLSSAEAGLRLRYEVTRQFAPYVGIVLERAFGRTGDLRRAEGEDTDDTRVIAGFRIWF